MKSPSEQPNPDAIRADQFLAAVYYLGDHNFATGAEQNATDLRIREILILELTDRSHNTLTAVTCWRIYSAMGASPPIVHTLKRVLVDPKTNLSINGLAHGLWHGAWTLLNGHDYINDILNFSDQFHAKVSAFLRSVAIGEIQLPDPPPED